MHGQQIKDRVFCIASLKQGPVISQTGEERGWGHPVTPLQYAVCDLRGACWKYGFQQFWGLDGCHAPTTALLLRGISGYNIVKVGDEGDSLAGSMSLLLLKEGSSKQYAFCIFFFFFLNQAVIFCYFFFLFLCQMNFCHKCMFFTRILLHSSEFHFSRDHYFISSQQVPLEWQGGKCSP